MIEYIDAHWHPQSIFKQIHDLAFLNNLLAFQTMCDSVIKFLTTLNFGGSDPTNES
jgi:hypothetical protein